MSALGDQIRATRLARGLSQPEAADEIGVRPSTLAHWEQDRRDPARGPVMIRRAIERWLRR